MKWISVKDKLPKIGKKCLFLTEDNQIIFGIRSQYHPHVFNKDSILEYHASNNYFVFYACFDQVKYWAEINLPKEE
jgi:Protein of unknown function (DUF551)